jgi:hypothetical protein
MDLRKIHVIAMLTGSAVTIVSLTLQPLMTSASVEMMMRGGATAFAIAAITKVAIQAVLLIPGLMVGWIARSHGMPLGLVAGALGSLIYSLFFGTHLEMANHPYLPNPWSWAIGEALTQGLIGAVAGGTAQLLRSNRSLERARER